MHHSLLVWASSIPFFQPRANFLPDRNDMMNTLITLQFFFLVRNKVYADFHIFGLHLTLNTWHICIWKKKKCTKINRLHICLFSRSILKRDTGHILWSIFHHMVFCLYRWIMHPYYRVRSYNAAVYWSFVHLPLTEIYILVFSSSTFNLRLIVLVAVIHVKLKLDFVKLPKHKNEAVLKIDHQACQSNWSWLMNHKPSCYERFKSHM